MNAIMYRCSAALNQQWLGDQVSSCHEYAREQALTASSSNYEIGRTGDRLASMLVAVQQTDVTAVIVNDIARLGEKSNDHLATVRRLHDAGATKEKIAGTQGALLVGVMQAHATAHDQLDQYEHRA